MNDSIDYYNQNATRFFADTVQVDLTPLHERFLEGLPAHALILDAGCGAGRDAGEFLKRGFRVVAFDASAAMASLAATHTGLNVATRRFEDVDEAACYDAVWACASLLHLPPAAIPDALQRLWSSLKSGGRMYVSFKYGAGERCVEGRSFTDANEPRIDVWLAALGNVTRQEVWISDDRRPDRVDRWLNAILDK